MRDVSLQTVSTEMEIEFVHKIIQGGAQQKKESITRALCGSL